MKELLLSRLSASSGRILTAIAASAVGWVTHFLARYQVTLSPEDANLVSGLAFLGAGWLIDGLVLHIQGRGVRKMQRAVIAATPPGAAGEAVVADSYAGPVTVAAVQQLSADSRLNPATPQT